MSVSGMFHLRSDMSELKVHFLMTRSVKNKTKHTHTHTTVTTPCVYPSPSLPLQLMYAADDISSVYGRRGTRLSPTLAAFVNGVAVSGVRWNEWVTTAPSAPDTFRTLYHSQTTSILCSAMALSGLQNTRLHFTPLWKFPTVCKQTLLGFHP